jgi:rhomboid protease GluP
MFKRQRVGSVVCPSCGSLVGVQDDKCYNCGRRNPGLWGFAPMLRRLGNDLGFVPLVIGGCTAIYIATLLVTVLLSGPTALRVEGLTSILPPTDPAGNLGALFLFGESGAVPVFYFGRWWTVLSAGWLHGNLLHILFNMMWVRQLAPAVADMYGAGRMMLIYTIAGVAGFLLSSAAGLFGMGGLYTVGASASIMGLLGALVHYGRKSVSSAVTSQALTYAVILFVFGLTMRGVDNFAHAGGFAGGYVASIWLNPLKPERADHLFAALVCVVLIGASVLASVVTGLQYLR